MPSESDDQITHLANQVISDGLATGLEGDDYNAPQVAIPSVLSLTKQEEERLQFWVEARFNAISREMGRDEMLSAGDTPDASAAVAGMPAEMLKSQDHGRGFLAKRRLHELNYNLKVEWREMAYGGIFAESNYPVPMSRRLVQQQIARAQNYFFATEPWFTASPEGRSDEEVARDVDRFAKYKSRKARVKATLSESIRQAFIRGEGILKTTYVNEPDIYETMAEVAVDAPGGSMVIAEDGDYVYREDTWIDETEEGFDPATGEPIQIPTGQKVLARDGKTPQHAPPALMIWETRKIARSITLRRGAMLDLVHFVDFLCPLHAPSVQEADFVAHIYERPALHIAQQVLSQSTPDRKGLVKRILQELTGASRKSGTGEMQYRTEVGERHASGEGTGDESEPRVKLAECYLRFDVNGDGVEESLFVLYDTEAKRLIYYDYLANITPDGRRPFHISRVNPVDNRWHGLSQMEVFEDQQKLVDLFLNRIVKATSDQATVKFWHPERTKEGEADPHLQYNDGSVYTPLDNWKAEDILETVVLVEPRILDMIKVVEFVQQNTLNLSGVTGGNDAQAAGMDSQKTATGIRNIDRTGQELFGPYLQALDEGLGSAVQSWIALELFHLDQAEVYEYFEGDTRLVGELTKERVRNLAVDVRLEMTRYRNEQQDLQLNQSIQLVMQFFAMPPELQMQLAPLFRQLLKLREIPDADRILQPNAAMTQQLPGPAVGPSQPATPINPVAPVGSSMPGQSEPLT